MKTAIKTLGFIGLTILLIFVLTKNKEIRQYKINEQKQLELLDTLQLELNDLRNEIKHLLERIDSIPEPTYMRAKDTPIFQNDSLLLSAIMMVESRNNDSAHAIGEDAVGVLQIRKCMVDDVNRILNRQKKELKFTYYDRWSRQKSIQMFEIYCEHYGLETAEEIARCWNGGPRGMDKEATSYYWEKVQDHLDS
tara:strand:- start:131 stop:712 length:582 start_codon:yes stop_codon:yes gene_type:complete